MNTQWIIGDSGELESRWRAGDAATRPADGTPAEPAPFSDPQEERTRRITAWIEYSAAGLMLAGLMLCLAFHG